MKRPDPILAGIAREHLRIPTLASRQADSLDFHNVAVWQVEGALTAAFNAGIQSAGRSAEHQDATSEEPVPTALPSPPLLVPKGTPLVPGKMYLQLSHGRTDPTQEMDGWGFAGPTFGPISCYVQTYCCDFHIHAECGSDEVWLRPHDDMIRWDGCFYGSLAVFIADNDDRA